MQFDNVCRSPVWMRSDERYRWLRHPLPGGSLLIRRGTLVAPRDLAP